MTCFNIICNSWVILLTIFDTQQSWMRELQKHVIQENLQPSLHKDACNMSSNQKPCFCWRHMFVQIPVNQRPAPPRPVFTFQPLSHLARKTSHSSECSVFWALILCEKLSYSSEKPLIIVFLITIQSFGFWDNKHVICLDFTTSLKYFRWKQPIG